MKDKKDIEHSPFSPGPGKFKAILNRNLTIDDFKGAVGTLLETNVKKGEIFWFDQSDHYQNILNKKVDNIVHPEHNKWKCNIKAICFDIHPDYLPHVYNIETGVYNIDTEEKKKDIDLKVGDYVKVVDTKSNLDHGCNDIPYFKKLKEKGSIHKITRIQKSGVYDFSWVGLEGVKEAISDNNLEKVYKNEDQDKHKELEVGDYVITSNYSNTYDGRLLRVIRISENQDGRRRYVYFKVFDNLHYRGTDNFNLEDTNYTILSEAEAIEYASTKNIAHFDKSIINVANTTGDHYGKSIITEATKNTAFEEFSWELTTSSEEKVKETDATDVNNYILNDPVLINKNKVSKVIKKQILI